MRLMKMVSLVQRVWKQALVTFAETSPLPPAFEDHFSKLKLLADKVTAADVKLDKCLLEWTVNCVPSAETRPPVTYIEIYEDNTVTIGIFVLRSGTRIPLHDHPQMHGILKVLAGTLKIQSYSLLPQEKQNAFKKACSVSGKNVTLAEKLPEVLINESDHSCTLSPVHGNLHEIHCVDGPAAFLDILAPPYDSSCPENGERSCHYFQEIPLGEKDGLNYKNTVALYHIPSPPEFWSDSAPYQGPVLRSGSNPNLNVTGGYLGTFLGAPNSISANLHLDSMVVIVLISNSIEGSTLIGCYKDRQNKSYILKNMRLMQELPMFMSYVPEQVTAVTGYLKCPFKLKVS